MPPFLRQKVIPIARKLWLLHGPTEIASRGRLKSPPEVGVFATPRKRVTAAGTEVIRLSFAFVREPGEMPKPAGLERFYDCLPS